MIRLNTANKPRSKVLVLGYGPDQTQIINALINKNCTVDHSSHRVRGSSKFDFVVCFGYRHIIDSDVIKEFGCPIFNLHISYLPFNRGAHPNFWSFYENTPSGVTLHMIDEGVDTGPIIAQKYVNFKIEVNTFQSTYNSLLLECEELFLEHLESLLSGNWVAKPQRSEGTHHYKKDLPTNFSGWTSNIKYEIEKLKREGLRYD